METNNQHLFLQPLNGLRVLALIVMFLHSVPYTPFFLAKAVQSLDWIILDLFFAISIFLATLSLITEHEKYGRINIRYFYIRKILRLLPLYYFYVVVALIFTEFQWDTKDSLIRILGILSLTSNLIDAWLGPSSNSYLNTLWFIPFLVQLHLALPLFYKIITSLTLHKKVLVCLAIIFLAVWVRYYFAQYGVRRLFIPMIPLLKPEAFLVGVLLAFTVSHTQKLPKCFIQGSWPLLPAVAILSLLIISNNPFTPFDNTRFIYLYPIANLLWGITILFVITSKNFFTKGLASRFFTYGATVLYGLYAYRWCSIKLTLYITSHFAGSIHNNATKWVILFVISACLAIIFSVVSYHFIERPFLSLKQRFIRVDLRSV